jgi:hypothetical protein
MAARMKGTNRGFSRYFHTELPEEMPNLPTSIRGHSVANT